MGARTSKGNPRRAARRARAAERGAAHVCSPTCKRFRTGKVRWVRSIDDVTVESVLTNADGSVTIKGRINASHMMEMPMAVSHPLRADFGR